MHLFFVTELNNLTGKEKVVLLMVIAAFLQVILLLLLNMATTEWRIRRVYIYLHVILLMMTRIHTAVMCLRMV